MDRRTGVMRSIALALVIGTASCGLDGDVERQARSTLRGSLEAESAPVRARYDEKRLGLIWVKSNGLNRSGKRMVETIRTADRDGLDAEAYGIAEALEALERAGDEQAGSDERGAALAAADMAITRGYVQLVRDLRLGTTTPKVVQPAWRMEPFDVLSDEDIDALLQTDPDRAVADARPGTAEYGRLSGLRAQLVGIRDEGGWPVIPEIKLAAGDRDPAVASLRARLGASLVAQEREDAALGRADSTLFDEGLDRALRSFQERHALETDGVTGPNTLAALNVSVDHRIRTVEINQERWRWMPHALDGRAVLVNIAGYKVHLLEDDRSVLTMNAVVGKAAWSTPIFADTMTHMVFNPYWNVPESILTEEVLPAARADRSYMDANNYEVVGPDGEVVDDGVIDDDDFAETHRVRQRPGPGNALGRVKFMFPNQEAVYLHDTPSKSLFAEPVRAFSHGCVRVEHPLELANFLMQWTGGDIAEVEAALASDETATIHLQHAVPVFLAYLTVWVGDDERPRFFPDVYGMDAQMVDRLVSTPGTRIAATSSRARGTGD